MKLVANTVEKIVSFIELAAGAFSDDLIVYKLIKACETAFGACHTENILIVTQSSAAFFDMWLLQEYGVGILTVAAA